MVENFEEGESKYGRIFKVAGPCKYLFSGVSLRECPNLTLVCSGRGREHVRYQDVRTGQSRLGKACW